MNRPLKFKVWDVEQNKFTLGYDNDDGSFGEIYSDPPGIFFAGLTYLNRYSDRYIIQQYTGLTDSKDKEICDGDILKIDYDTFGNVIGQVVYETDQGAYIFQYKRNGPNQHHTNLNCDVAFESVIVGNIFEHSELLK